jgi:hypothetical protein
MNQQLPRGIRNHNPGNIRRSGDPWQGLAKDQNDAAFFQFSEAKWGIRALARVLISYQDKHGLRTVRGIISRWAPPVENKTSNYIDHVAHRLGVGVDDALDVHDYSVLRGLVEAIIAHENGQQPYTSAQIDAGLVLAGVAPPEKPITQTRTIKGAQVAAGATALGVVAEAVEKIQPAMPLLQRIVEVAPWLLAVLTLAGIGYVVWARYDDRRRGLR